MVLFHPGALVQHKSDPELPEDLLFIRGPEVPLERLFWVRVYTLAQAVHGTEVQFGLGVTLLGGGVEPPQGGGVVAVHPDPVVVHRSELKLCQRVILFGSLQVVVEGPGVIPPSLEGLGPIEQLCWVWHFWMLCLLWKETFTF